MKLYTLLRVISTMTFQDAYLNIYLGILSGIHSDSLSDKNSGILSGIYSDILSAILSGNNTRRTVQQHQEKPAAAPEAASTLPLSASSLSVSAGTNLKICVPGCNFSRWLISLMDKASAFKLKIYSCELHKISTPPSAPGIKG